MDTNPYDDELRRMKLAMASDVARLLKADADIMDSVKEMVRVGKEEAARNPRLLFDRQTNAGAAGDILGGQTGGASVLENLLDLVKDEKEFIQRLIEKLLRL